MSSPANQSPPWSTCRSLHSPLAGAHDPPTKPKTSVVSTHPRPLPTPTFKNLRQKRGRTQKWVRSIQAHSMDGSMNSKLDPSSVSASETAHLHLDARTSPGFHSQVAERPPKPQDAEVRGGLIVSWHGHCHQANHLPHSDQGPSSSLLLPSSDALTLF